MNIKVTYKHLESTPALDEMVLALEKQVRKNKEMLKNHHYKKVSQVA